MIQRPRKPQAIPLLVLVLFLASLACNLNLSKSQPEGGKPLVVDESYTNKPFGGQSADEPTPQSLLPFPSEDITGEASSPGALQEVPVDEALLKELSRYEPSSDELPADYGKSREKPYPTYTRISTPYWDLQVRDVLRGADAWQIIQKQWDKTPPPPDGLEYLLVKVQVHAKIQTSISINELYVTGDRNLVVTDSLVDYPVPELYYTDIYTAEVAEGWTDALVGVDEHNLELVFDKTNERNWQDKQRFTFFIALEDGASLTVPPDLAGIQPNDLGKDLQNSAPIGSKVISEDWEITVLETERGTRALEIAQEANQYVPEPDSGMEYIVFKARLRYIGNSATARTIYGDNFQSIGSNGEFYKAMGYGSTNLKWPWLRGGFYPGGEVVGWLAVLAKIGETSMKVVFKPDIHQSGSPEVNVRYLALEP
jgi:hypothetical protein